MPTIEIPSHLTTIELSIAQTVSELNIYLYKGYIYDQETGLYYCQTRYYNPHIGRWLSIDSIDYLDPNSINGLNLYAYCGNNPVMYTDPSGKFPFLITMTIIGLIIGAGIGAGVGISKGHTNWQLAGDIALGSIIGATAGALIGASISGALTGSFFSIWPTVKAGAHTVYGMYKAGGTIAASYMMLDNLGHSFSSFTHVFWSGGDVAKNAADNHASNIGGKTLEMTRLGKYLERNFSDSNYDQGVWTLASKNFANQISRGNSVNAILYYPGMRMDAVWFEEAKELGRRLIEIIVGR